jgi:hypothetical protein
MRVFLDTSALVKAHVAEKGDKNLANVLATAHAVLVSVLAEPEAISAMNRLRRERKMTDAQYAQVKTRLSEDLQTFDVIELDRGILDHAVRLLEQHPLRAADALHLASAQSASADLFVTSDQPQLAAARTLGLKALDPEST